MSKIFKNLYVDVYYEYGDSHSHYKEISDYSARLASYGMPDLPDLWGFGKYYEVAGSAQSFLDRAMSRLLKKMNEVKGRSAVIICCPNTFTKKQFIDSFFKNIVTNGFETDYILPISDLGCTSMMVAIEIAGGLLESQTDFDNVIIVGAEIGDFDNIRMKKFALYSDFLGAVVISKNEISNITVRSVSNMVDPCSCYSDSSENFEEVNRKCFSVIKQNCDSKKIVSVYMMNLYIPLTVMKYKSFGLDQEFLYTDAITTRGHCGGLDPFISLVEDSYEKTGLCLLNTQDQGRSSILAVEKHN